MENKKGLIRIVIVLSYSVARHMPPCLLAAKMTTYSGISIRAEYPVVLLPTPEQYSAALRNRN